tara:strand:- start:159 stop:467 length:309 start_codon:yes stop_codon:yes gene_type:complete
VSKYVTKIGIEIGNVGDEGKEAMSRREQMMITIDNEKPTKEEVKVYVGKKDGKSLNKGEQWTKKTKDSDLDEDCGLIIKDTSFEVINKKASVTFQRPLIVFA